MKKIAKISIKVFGVMMAAACGWCIGREANRIADSID